jgi:hypothetical protein
MHVAAGEGNIRVISELERNGGRVDVRNEFYGGHYMRQRAWVKSNPLPHW